MSHIHLPGPLCYVSIKIKWLSQYWKSWDLGAGPLHVFGNWAWKMCPSLADPKNRIYDLWGQRPSSCSSLNWFSGNWSIWEKGTLGTLWGLGLEAGSRDSEWVWAERSNLCSRGKSRRRYVSKINDITIAETLGPGALWRLSWTLVLGFASRKIEPGLGIMVPRSFPFKHLIKHHLLGEGFPYHLT